jgi:hypothetical protein
MLGADETVAGPYWDADFETEFVGQAVLCADTLFYVKYVEISDDCAVLLAIAAGFVSAPSGCAAFSVSARGIYAL